jgi:hypothetical protein
MRITNHPLDALSTPPEAYSCDWILALNHCVGVSIDSGIVKSLQVLVILLVRLEYHKMPACYTYPIVIKWRIMPASQQRVAS